MAKWDGYVLTQKGRALNAKLIDGNALTIVKAVAGTGYVEPSELKYLTKLPEEKQEISFSVQAFPDEGKCAIPVTLRNTGITTAYQVTHIGIIAFDPDEGEILYLISQATDGDGTEVPAENENPGFSAAWNFFIEYTQAENVTVTVNPSNTVTAKEAQAMIDAHDTADNPHSGVLATKQELSDHKADQDNPHNVTAAQLGLDKVNNTPDSEKNVAFASEAAAARKVNYGLIVRLKGGQTEGTDMWTYNGSTSKSINITPVKIGAAEEDHTHTPAEIGAVAMARITVTLAASSWSGNQQTVPAPGVLADESKCHVIPSPDPASRTLYNEAGVYGSAQGADTLTFTCEDVPSADLTVNVLILI